MNLGCTLAAQFYDRTLNMDSAFWRSAMEDISDIISGQRVETDFVLSPQQIKVFWQGWETIKKGCDFDDMWLSQEEVIDVVLEDYPYKEMSPSIDWKPFEDLRWLQKIEVLKQVFTGDMYHVLKT